MYKLFATLILLLWLRPLPAQWQRAFLLPNGAPGAHPVEAPIPANGRSDEDAFKQIPGYPKGFRADPVFKNLRNLTLADLDGDGADEIIVGIDDQLYAFKNDQLLWQKSLEGVAIYPPSVADVDDDGAPEIVQITGGTGATAAYLLEADGSDFPNWPQSFNDNWLLTSPVLVDLDGDDIMEILILERVSPNGNVHILRLNGDSFSPDWPVALMATPAVTPSVGDVDQDGEPEIVVNTTEARYILRLDGQFEDGFPIVTHPRQRHSYQSPILVDLDGNGDLEIVGATHSDNTINLPEFYIMQPDGSYYSGWPIPVPGRSWTFNTPTVVEIDGAYRIFMSRPIGTEAEDMLYCWNKDGDPCPGFPIVKPGGLEGIISVADVDGDEVPELVFGTNLIDPQGKGRIHAYELDGTGEVPGFPIHPYGWTFLNGAALGDVDGNDTLDLVALSYTQTFNQGIDSAFVHVYNLGVPHLPDHILWGTYKGDNTRRGLVGEEMVSAASLFDLRSLRVQLYPNPAVTSSLLSLELAEGAPVAVDLLDAAGRFLRPISRGFRTAGSWNLEIPLNREPAAWYFVRLQVGEHVGLLKLAKVR